MQDRTVIFGQYVDANIACACATTTIVDRIAKPGISIEIWSCLKHDFASSIDTNFSVRRKAFNAHKCYGIAISIPVVGEQRCRINDNDLVFKDCEAIVHCFWSIIGWQHFDSIVQSGTCAAGINHIKCNCGKAFGVRRECND